MPRLGKPFTDLPEDLRPWRLDLNETGLVVHLVIDSPESVIYVNDKVVGASGRPGQEWLALALDNLRARTPPDCFELVDEPSGLRYCGRSDGFDSARALLLDELLPRTRELGCFVGVPDREQVLVVPVTGQGLMQLHMLHYLIGKRYAVAAYTISDSVFWVQGGVWRPFPVQFKDGRLALWPPEEFFPVLERIKAQSGADRHLEN
jgi:hypothetical protein